MNDRRYLIISPCRDEAAYLQRTLESVVQQTAPPSLWIIVDDGSRDQSPHLVLDYASRYPWIRLVRRPDRGKRQVGAGVVEAFNDGLAQVDLRQFDYLCKLDLDLDLPPQYFETLMERMERLPRLGSCSGKPYYLDPDTHQAVPECCGDEMSVGMAKFYRTRCFQEIGGLVPQVMWDGIDCHRCRMLGWLACSWNDESLRFLHLRPMGSSERGLWTGRCRHGFGQYYMGASPFYMLASCLYRLPHRPRIVGSLAMAFGYFSAMIRRQQRYPDQQFRRFLRRYQWRCLLRGKGYATRTLNQKNAQVWAQRRQGSWPPPGGDGLLAWS